MLFHIANQEVGGRQARRARSVGAVRTDPCLAQREQLLKAVARAGPAPDLGSLQPGPREAGGSTGGCPPPPLSRSGSGCRPGGWGRAGLLPWDEGPACGRGWQLQEQLVLSPVILENSRAELGWRALPAPSGWWGLNSDAPTPSGRAGGCPLLPAQPSGPRLTLQGLPGFVLPVLAPPTSGPPPAPRPRDVEADVPLGLGPVCLRHLAASEPASQGDSSA